MERLTKKTSSNARILLIVYILLWMEQVESFTKPEFMLPSESPYPQQNEDRKSLSGDSVAGTNPPHIFYPNPSSLLPQQQHQPIVMDDTAPPIPSQYSPNSFYLESPPPLILPTDQHTYYMPLYAGGRLLPLGFSEPISIPPPLPPLTGQINSWSAPIPPNFDSGTGLNLSGTLRIISDVDARKRCPYQGFHSFGPTYESAYLVCIPGENNMFIGMEVSCPKGQLFSQPQTRCVSEEDVEKEKQMIRMLEAIGEMRERLLVPYAMGRVNDGENLRPAVIMEIVEEPVTSKHITDLQEGLGQPEKHLEENDELDGTEVMDEFFEKLFVGAEQEREQEHLFFEEDQERILELAELLEETEKEEFGKRAEFLDAEIVGGNWEEVQRSTDLGEAGASFEEKEDVALEAAKEKGFDKLNFDETLESGLARSNEMTNDAQVQELQAEVKQVEQFNSDVVSELLRAEDWVVVDKLHKTELV